MASRKDQKELIQFAESLGFRFSRAKCAHLKFCIDGLPPVFTSATPSDHRAWMNARSNLRRVANLHQTP